ncbi:MAG: cob(I)yrinic acid a,c-diamide adenosyltransferase [Gammaproteobacteria bacterium]|nr:cob(I)yrinic acid a,c-diamide adenosyltransferase [Gammaproteobacteria bacterium]
MKHRLTRITTRTGDSGESGLADGTRHAKTDVVFAAMGDIDELNCGIGVVVARLCDGPIRSQLQRIQSALFDLGATLAVPGTPATMLAEIAELEASITSHNSTLGPLQNFVLPGGCAAAADLHLARAICRRAERTYWHHVQETHEASPAQARATDRSGAIYLNRLSDCLFVLARTINAQEEHAEAIWTPRSQRSE